MQLGYKLFAEANDPKELDMDQYRTLAMALDRTTEKDLRRTRPRRPGDAARRRPRLLGLGR